MGESSMKPIQINPELFNMKKNKTQKNKSLKIRNIQPNKLKNDLLSRIKNYKKEKKELDDLDRKYNHNEETFLNNKNSLDQESLEKNTNDEFTESINFLKKISIQNNDSNVNNLNNVNNDLIINDEPMIINNNFDKKNSDDHPGYGCLKNGSMPTFREWKRMTLKNKDNQNGIDLSNEPAINFKKNNDTNSINNDTIKNDILQDEYFKNNKNLKKKNITYKYSLGKKNGKVSVLIKNNKTRKKIMDEHMRMKQVNIHDMKKYLKRHNFLKSGSYAPSDIIKKMYEECLLSGNLKNISSENIHSNLEEN